MYYWSKNASKIILEDELYQFKNVKEIFIGTAFISWEGLRILEEIIKNNDLKKNQVHIYLSDEFSQDKPHELLAKLSNIAKVKIFLNHTFHSKVYLLKGKSNKLIFGSSNFTAGGFYKNIEFNSIDEIEGEKMKQVESFFTFCDFNAIEVNDEIIKYYKDNQEEIENLKQAQIKLKKKIKGYIHQDDELDPDDYDIEDYYFDFSDYETFFARNKTRNDADIRELREKVQEKMLALHKKVNTHIKKLGLNCHWNPKHISSMIRPCEFNKGRVGWLGIRYGKSKKEIDVVNQWLDANEKDEIKGFQKHGCLQYCIIPDGFEINLFLAVRYDAIDRAHVQEKMDQLNSQIIKEIEKLKGYGMIWGIYNEESNEYNEFQIDNEDANEFCKFLLKHDKEGCTSSLRLYYPVDDNALIDIDSISNEIITYFEKLIPLYNVMVWRPKV